MRALVAGFEPYGGRHHNPAREVARILDGTRIGDIEMTALELPVDLVQAPRRLVERIDALSPDLVLCLGLWPGEPVIRVERAALNCLDFEIPDLAGHRTQGEPVEAGGPDGMQSTLPLARILDALLHQGIPARLSATAGTYLCNATLYRLLRHAQTHRPGLRAGFMHLPYLPAQVAELMQELRASGTLELHQRADLASMDLTTMLAAVRTTLRTCADSPPAP